MGVAKWEERKYGRMVRVIFGEFRGVSEGLVWDGMGLKLGSGDKMKELRL